MASGGKSGGFSVPSRYKRDQKTSSSGKAKEKSSVKSIERSGEFSGSISLEAASSKFDGNKEVTSTPFVGRPNFPSLDVTAVPTNLNVPHTNLKATNSKFAATKEVTSTPFLRTPKFPSLDVTALSSNLSAPHTNPSKESSASRVKNIKKDKRLNTTCIQKRSVDINKRKILEAELDILYVEYLQAAFLENESKRALVERNKIGLKKIYHLLNLIEIDMNKIKDQGLLLNLMILKNTLFEHAEKQKAILKPVFDIVPILEARYRSLAEAVEATKHKLPIREVLLPGNLNKLTGVLQAIKEFLLEFPVDWSDVEELNETANQVERAASMASSIASKIKRAVDLEKEIESLLLTSSSLSLGSKELGVSD